jgi:CheY-like chemotaxis protein
MKLIALTGYGQSADMREGRAAGFDLHLVKPVEPARLDEALRDATPGLPRGRYSRQIRSRRCR